MCGGGGDTNNGNYILDKTFTMFHIQISPGLVQDQVYTAVSFQFIFRNAINISKKNSFELFGHIFNLAGCINMDIKT